MEARSPTMLPSSRYQRFKHVVGQDVRTSWMAKEKNRGLKGAPCCAPSVLSRTLSPQNSKDGWSDALFKGKGGVLWIALRRR
jgi:hypothetical protein